MRTGREMKVYRRRVHYYETDGMGITHHANVVRWLEEARIDWLAQLGWPYDRLTAMGLDAPVLALKGRYKESTTFPDEVAITVRLSRLKGLRFWLRYDVVKAANGHRAFTGETAHCFVDAEGRPVRLDRAAPDFYALLKRLSEAPKGSASDR
ncbi:acyl-CoA thioesterase [Pseudoramibacter alactolyticus]